MKSRRMLFSLSRTVLLAMAIVYPDYTSPVEAASDPIVVIGNVANPVENLSMSDLKKLFMSDRSRWETGKPWRR
jgi:hypothetical protein